MFDLTQYFILAIVQGITEFLPISSSAHLLLFSKVLGFQKQPLFIDILLHFSTLLAVIIYFIKDIKRIFLGVIKGKREEMRYALALVFATIPIVFFALFLYDSFEMFRVIQVVAISLVVSGILLYGIDYLARKGWACFDVQFQNKGIVIGLFQVFALIPGISRSGITISAGRLVGLSRVEASRFSFLLSIPTIIGALVFTILKHQDTSVIFSQFTSFWFLIIMAVTFFTAFLAMHYFLKLVDRFGFTPFFVYQIALGLILLLVY